MKKRNKALILWAAILAVAGYCIFENATIGVTEYSLESDKISGSIRVCHLSDIHVKNSGWNFEQIIKKTAAQNPDIILVTGDLIDSRVSDISRACTLIETLCEIAPVYYVTGNHEERLPADIYATALKQIHDAGAVLLKDRAEKIDISGNTVNVMGLFDRSYPDLSLIGSMRDENALNLLAVHRPQFAEEYAESGADIAFCGHAHGGQIRIPFVGGVFSPDQYFFPKYFQGVHTFEKGSTVISRGIGTNLFIWRINNRPEIVSVEIKGKKE